MGKLTMNIFLLVSTVFYQKTLYNAYNKRARNIEIDVDEHNKVKEADSEFYRDASSLQYGKVSIFGAVVFITFFYWTGTKNFRGKN